MDADGLVVAAIPAAARLAYVTPSHQFPLGVSMSLARRLELLAWARARGAVVIEDDYDSEFRYGGAPLPALQGLGDASRVVYVGTFSNAMFPGLRIGYLVLPPRAGRAFRAGEVVRRPADGLARTGGARGLHPRGPLRAARPPDATRLQGRREALLDALARHFGPRATIVGDAAGMHVVVRFDGPDIARRAGARTACAC